MAGRAYPARNPASHLAHHFESLEKQAHAARLGMWLFLATELLLFGALLAGYVLFRVSYPAGFVEASHHLSRALGTVDTFVLVTSSLSAAMGIHWTHHGRVRAATGALLATALLGLTFLGIHGYEYWEDVHHGALPGRLFHVAGVTGPGAGVFFALYFLLTGLHSLHVAVGVAILLVLAWRTARGDFSAAYDTPLELGGMYWHLVDLVWIFLYPLLYLV